MKITVADYNAFWAAVGGDWYLDDVDQDPANPDGQNLAEMAVVNIRSGALAWQGKGRCADSTGLFTKSEIINECAAYTAVIRRWIKARARAETMTRVLVEVPNVSLGQFEIWLKSLGGKVLA